MCDKAVKNNVFLLGSTGYLGSHLASGLSSESSLRSFSVGRLDCDYEVDLEKNQYESFLSALKSGDTLVFMAAISSPAVCENNRSLAYDVNVTHTISLIKALVRLGVRVIFISSDAVFGSSRGVCKDDSSLNPLGAYGEMKASVEREFCKEALVKTVRLSYVLGKGDKYSEMLKSFSERSESVDVYNGFSRNIVHIDDVTEGLTRLIKQWDRLSERRFNFSGPKLVSRALLTKLIAKAILPNLNYRVIDAPAEFWAGRSRVIETDCFNFSNLLGRKPYSVDLIIKNWS